jgi:hypothetical protein
MVGPMPVTVLRRVVIVDTGDAYVTGSFRWLPREIAFGSRVAKNDDHPAVRAAIAGDPRIRAVLVWARFPYYELQSSPDSTIVRLRDLRFGDRVGAVQTLVDK